MMKPVLVVGTGLAGVGKTTYFLQLHKDLPNSTYLDKDIINNIFLGEYGHDSDFYRKHVKFQSYQLLLALTRQNLKPEHIVIVDGYFGGKLELLKIDEIDPTASLRLIYFKASADYIWKKLNARNSFRDKEKIQTKEDFLYYFEKDQEMH